MLDSFVLLIGLFGCSPGLVDSTPGSADSTPGLGDCTAGLGTEVPRARYFWIQIFIWNRRGLRWSNFLYGAVHGLFRRSFPNNAVHVREDRRSNLYTSVWKLNIGPGFCTGPSRMLIIPNPHSPDTGACNLREWNPSGMIQCNLLPVRNHTHYEIPRLAAHFSSFLWIN